MVTDDAMKKGAHAGKLIKEVAAVVGGGGGGRPNIAQAGGKNRRKIDEAAAKKLLRYWKARSHNNKQEKQHKIPCRLPGQKKEPGRRQGKNFAKMKKLVDVRDFSGIIRTVCKKYPYSCIMHNLQLEGG